MNRSEVRRRLALAWWCYLAAALAPLLVLNLLFGGSGPGSAVLHMPLFIAGLASMFISLRLFSNYKLRLIATQAALDTPHEAAAWVGLARVRRLGLLGAAVPAWVAALAVFSGLNGIALILLALSSVVIGCLYRIPAQLG